MNATGLSGVLGVHALVWVPDTSPTSLDLAISQTAKAGYGLLELSLHGPITFESFSTAVVAEGLSGELAIWRNLWTDGFELAVHARRFMEGHAAANKSAGA